MTIKEYRLNKGLTQRALCDELSKVFPGMDVPLISKMESGICEPSVSLQAYINANAIEEGYELNTTQAMILDRLKKTTPEDRLSRRELSILTSLCDRDARREIVSMRKKGVRIGTDSSKGGYYLIENEEEYGSLRNEYVRRITDMASTLKAMDTYTKGQVRING